MKTNLLFAAAIGAILTAAIKSLIDWVLSPVGQKVVTDVGYHPLPKAKSDEKTKTASDTYGN